MTVCERCTENNNCAWQNHEDTICHDAPAFPLTNADRIRSMTDEELAQVLRNPCDIADHGPTGWCKERNCGYQCALDWLKEKATE